MGHHPFFHVPDDIFPPGGDGIDLVDEDDAGSLTSGLLKDLAQVGLGLAIELVHHLRAAHREKVGLGLVGDGAGDEGLAAAGGAVEQHPFGRVDAQALEQLRVAQRQFDHLPDALELGLEAADVLVGHRRLHGFRGPGLADHQGGGGVDQHRPPGGQGFHLEIGGAAAEQGGPDAVPLQHRQAVQEAADILEVPLGRGNGDGGKDHPFAGAAGDLLHLDEIIYPGAGVFPADAVQLHPGPAPQFLVGRHGLADRGPLAHDLHDVTDGHLEFFQVFRSHAGISPAHVFAQGLRHFQLEGQRLQIFSYFSYFSSMIPGLTYRTHLISRMPLLQVIFIFSWG